MGEGPVGLAPVDAGGGLADADEPGGHDGVGGEGAPDGLTRTSSPRRSALRRTTSCAVNGACNSAVSTGRSKAPAFSAASRADGESVNSRTPSPCASMRWSIP